MKKRRKQRRPLLGRLAEASIRHHWIVLAVWAVSLVALGVASGILGRNYSEDFDISGTETQKAANMLQQNFPGASEQNAQLVIRAPRSLYLLPAKQQAVNFLQRLEKEPMIASVSSPYGSGGAVSQNKRVALVHVSFSAKDHLPERSKTQKLIEKSEQLSPKEWQVFWGGRIVTRAYSGPVVWSEAIGIVAALLVLLLALRSVPAAFSPLLSTLLSLGSVLILVALCSNWVSIAEFAPQLAAMIGLGVGIDYGLFIVARYRSEREGGKKTNEAIAASVESAGRTVVFAGLTVVAALAGMCLLGISFLYGLAIAMALAVGAGMLASLTALPALLHLLGNKIDSLAIGKKKKKCGNRWKRWTSFVSRRPEIVAIVSCSVLIVFAIPLFFIDLGASDAGSDPEGQTSRLAYDTIEKNFGPGANGPLLIIGRGTPGKSIQVLSADRGIASWSNVQTSADKKIWRLVAIPTSSPEENKTEQTIERIRHHLPPSVFLGGETAATIDFGKLVTGNLGLFFGVVIAISVLLLMTVFRSLLLSIKAALLNLLSIAASLGATVAVFQWGIFGGSSAPIEPFLPVMLFAIIFGLSMDYEVFLLSRIQEEWKESGRAKVAINRGLLATGRVITAAAAIMIVVFLAFVFSPERVVREFGFALAFAVFLDALVIRCALVPAIMHLLGKWAWWMPQKLEQILPEWKLETPPRK